MHGGLEAGKEFQPALPLRGVTHPLLRAHLLELISTRTPLAGSDYSLDMAFGDPEEFQPALPLRGVTVDRVYRHYHDELFQPALPLRGVTPGVIGADAHVVFQPALPLRGVTVLLHLGFSTVDISTRTPLAGSDYSHPRAMPTVPVFQPALPLRGVTTENYNGKGLY